MSKAKDALKAIHETGEPDQDYNKDFYNAVCKKLKKAGFECSHREFDKYQGVYIQVKNPNVKIWTTDEYVTGVKSKPTTPHEYSFTFEKGTETYHYVLQPEDGPELEVTYKEDGSANVSELTKYLRSLLKKGR